MGADHHRAVEVLKQAGNDVVMVVGREVITPALPASQPPQEAQPQQVKVVEGGRTVYASVG